MPGRRWWRAYSSLSARSPNACATREGDQALHEHGEDDEEDDHQAEGGGPCAEAEDHAGASLSHARRWETPARRVLHRAVARAVVQEVAEGRRQRRHDDDRPRLEDHVEDLGRACARDWAAARRRSAAASSSRRARRSRSRSCACAPSSNTLARPAATRSSATDAPASSRDAAAKAPPRDRHLVLDVRGEVVGGRHRGGSSPPRVTAPPRARLPARAEVPGERRAAAVTGRAERDADAEVAGSGRRAGSPGARASVSHERTIDAGVARPPLPQAIVSPIAHDDGAVEVAGAIDALLRGRARSASRARRSRCGPCRGCARRRPSPATPVGRSAPSPWSPRASLIRHTVARTARSSDAGEGRLRAPAQADAAAAGTSEHATEAATMHRVRCRAMGGGGTGPSRTTPSSARTSASFQISGMLETRWALIAARGSPTALVGLRP